MMNMTNFDQVLVAAMLQQNQQQQQQQQHCQQQQQQYHAQQSMNMIVGRNNNLNGGIGNGNKNQLLQPIPSLQKGVAKFHEAVAQIELKGKQRKIELNVKCQQQAKIVELQRKQLHQQAEQQKNQHFYRLYEQFGQWVQQMSQQKDNVDAANNKHNNNNDNNNTQIQPQLNNNIPFSVSSIPKRSDNNGNSCNNNHNNNNNNQSSPPRFVIKKPTNVPQLRSDKKEICKSNASKYIKQEKM